MRFVMKMLNKVQHHLLIASNLVKCQNPLTVIDYRLTNNVQIKREPQLRFRPTKKLRLLALWSNLLVKKH